MSMRKTLGNWYQYSGVIHIHTTASDGTRPLEEVIEIGREVGLDFMMFCDHMTLRHREEGREGFYGDTLVTIGYEHNDKDDRNHYLLFDSPEVYRSKESASEYVAAGVADGALGIIAHPDEVRSKLAEYPPYPWTDWEVEGFTGIEVWNQMSEWMERLTRFNKLLMAFSPRKSMVAPRGKTLRRWDRINLKRRCVGVAGADAHAFRIRAWPFTVEVFPYKVHFRSLRCYVLLPQPMGRDASTAREQLYKAIRECRLFFANVRWGEAGGFEFWAESDGVRAICGQWLPLKQRAHIHARLPHAAEVRLIHDGREVHSTRSSKIAAEVSSPGVYRLEAHRFGRGWIYTNHIRIGTEDDPDGQNPGPQ
jgi:hypothetical protein